MIQDSEPINGADSAMNDSTNEAEQQHFHVHQSPITGCSFSKPGDKLVSASKDATIVVWNVFVNPTNQKCTLSEQYKIANAHMDWITDIEWSNSSDFFLTASNDYTMKIWSSSDAVNGEKVHLKGHNANINACAFQYGCAVSACSDGSVKVWSHKGPEITTLVGHQNRVNACDLWVKLKANNAVADSTDSSDLLAWSERVEQDVKKKSSNREQYQVDSVYLVTVGDDGTIRLWKPIESDYLASLEGHNDKVNMVSVGKDGMVATCASDKSVNLWNMKPYFNKIASGKYDCILFYLCGFRRTIKSYNK
jgi:telomerase protein component 1